MRRALGSYARRTLEQVAEMVAGGPVEVVLSARLPVSVLVMAQSRSIVLREGCCGLYDVALGAYLLRRGDRLRFPFDRSQLDEWIRADRRALRRRFAGIELMPGTLRDAGRESELELVWGREDWTRSAEDGTTVGFEQCGEQVVREGVARGDLRPVDRSDLREMPVVELPRTVPPGWSDPVRQGELEEELRRCRRHSEGFLRCYEAKTEWVQDLRGAQRRVSAGSRLDTGRLAESAVQARAGSVPRAFLGRGTRAHRGHRPGSHLVVIGLDLAGPRSGDLQQPALARRFLLSIVQAFSQLPVELAIVGFHDRVCELADGRRAYVHSPTEIKKVDEPMGRHAWSRLDAALAEAAEDPQAAAFCPVQLESLIGRVRELRQERPFVHHHVAYFCDQGLGEGQAADFWSRSAESVERLLHQAEAEFDSGWDGVEVVPRALRAAAPRGSRTAELGTL